MKIQQLKYFIEVCNCGTITQAADRLFVSQPSITAAIKELEQDVGVNLFMRVNKRLVLTKEGEFLLSKAERIVREIDDIKNELRAIAGDNRKIRLGLPAQTTSFLVPIVLGEFCDKHPDIDIEIVELGGYDLLELLEKENIDIMIMTHFKNVIPIFKYYHLYNTEYRFITYDSHPLANRTSIKLEELNGEKLIMLNRGYSVRKNISNLFAEHKVTPHIISTTEHLSTIKAIVQSKIASTFLAKDSISFDDSCRIIKVDECIEIPVSLLVKKKKILTDSQKQLVKFMIDRFRK